MLFSRILLIAVATVAASAASAQENRRDHRKQSQKAPADQVALDPTSPGAPLPSLPPLTGQTWRHWLLPDFTKFDTPLLNSNYLLTVVNFGRSTVTATVACYHRDTGTRLVNSKKTIGPGRTAFVRDPRGWCRVSADKPVYVYGLNIYTERNFDTTRPGGAGGFGRTHRQIVEAVPYPAE